MNIYKSLNDITKYIDEHLEEAIDYDTLAKFLGVNAYTMKRLFTMIAGISISEYIRKRRLSNAGFDLYQGNSKIVDVASKYCYDNATSFSRAFYNYHGIKPSKVNKEAKLKNYPRLIFNEDIKVTTDFNYEIITLDTLELYGKSIEVNNKTISKKAPRFIKEIKSKYGDINYGMITYDSLREESHKYYCLFDKKIEDFEHVIIPTSKWLKFSVGSRESSDIQAVAHKFYEEFWPSCKYNLKELPELEYYHDGQTDFLVAIF